MKSKNTNYNVSDKYLIFSHKNDIDGMGSVVLLKLAYKDVQYELCDSNDISVKFKEYYKKGLLQNYKKIFVTDIHFEKDILDMIQKDPKLRKKVLIFDHNESALKYNSYDFVDIKIKNNENELCATTIFYTYLIQNRNDKAK